MGQTTSMFSEPRTTWHEVEGTRGPNRDPAHLNDAAQHYKQGQTLYTVLHEYRRQHDDGSRNIFGWRKMDPTTGDAGEYHWITYARFLDEVAVMSAAMVHELGLKRQEPVGVFSKNRYEWVLVEHAVNRMSYQLVPLYDTLGPEAIPFIINQTEMRVIFVAKQQYPTLMKTLDKCPTVKIIIQYEAVDNSQKQEASAKDVQLKSMSEILEAGMKKPVDADPPLPSDDLLHVRHDWESQGCRALACQSHQCRHERHPYRWYCEHGRASLVSAVASRAGESRADRARRGRSLDWLLSGRGRQVYR